MTTLFSAFMFEIGVLGVFLALAICYVVFRDSLVVARVGVEPYGALGVAWAAVTVIFAMTVFYINHSASTALTYLFWYGSGLVAAHRMRLVNDSYNRISDCDGTGSGGPRRSRV